MKRHIAIACLAACSAVAASACDVETRTVEMRIDHYREPCWGVGPSLCLRILDSSDTDVTPTQGIGGFDYEWGYVYDVVVDVHELSYAAADGRTVDYALVEVVSREPVEPGASFRIDLTADYVARVDSDDFQLVGGVSARCEEPWVCGAIADAMRTDEAFRVELGHPPAPGAPFVAHHVEMLGGE